MFRGVNALNLDNKGRLAIPTRYRDELVRLANGQMVITVDRDHSLLLYPMPEWEEIERKLVKLPSFNVQARRLQRLLIGYSYIGRPPALLVITVLGADAGVVQPGGDAVRLPDLPITILENIGFCPVKHADCSLGQ